MTASIKVNIVGLWQDLVMMKYLPRNFQDPLFKSSLRRFEKTGNVSPQIFQLEDRILHELNEQPSPKGSVQVKATHLYLQLSRGQNLDSGINNWHLFRTILKTRGKLRWLCFRLMPDVFPNSYEISRGKLLVQVLLNWEIFKADVLSKLYIKETISREVIEIDSYEFTHPNIDFEFSLKQVYLLGGEFAQDLEFGLNSNQNKRSLRKFLLGRLIFWDSSTVLNLIRQSDKLSSDPNFVRFLKHFPDLGTQISRQIKLRVEIHPSAALTFDERKERGQASPDILQNVSVWHQRFILEGETWHVVDSTSSPYNEFVAGHWQFLESIPGHLEHIHLKKPGDVVQIVLKEAIYLLGRADENWYHLLLDTLPRYLQLKDIDKGVPVLVRSDLPDTTLSFIESLIPHTIVLVCPNNVVSVEKLFFIAARSTVYDSKPSDGQDQVQFSRESLRELSDWVVEKLDNKIDVNFPNKIYTPRRAKYRNLINGARVQLAIETFGFETVETNSSFYAKQHSYFNRANHVVSPGGAVLANIVFMRQGSKITLIRSWRDSDLLLWKKLAEACGLYFDEAIGIPTYYGRKALARQHSNYFVPVKRVKKLLKTQNKLT